MTRMGSKDGSGTPGGSLGGLGRQGSKPGMGSMGGLGGMKSSKSNIMGLSPLVGSKHDLASMFSSNAVVAKPLKFFTCTVGAKASEAEYFVSDVEEVAELLRSLRLQGARRSSDNFNT